MVGIFWFILVVGEVHLVAYTLMLDNAEPYGDCLTCPLSHIDAWEATKRGAQLLTPLDTPTRAVIASSEYEKWPRGRVVYERGAQRYVVYADQQAYMHTQKLCEVFQLPDDVVFLTDLHYRNSKRLLQSSPV